MTPSTTPTIVSTDKAFAEAVDIVTALQKAGFKGYFVGGCVRDLLFGLTPQDYDIATDAKPEDVQRIFPRARGFGKRFGVSILPTKSGDCEVAAFREDGFYYDHRRPAWVNYAGLAEDAQRRDFTINALYYDPVSEQIIDLVDGQADLQERILRIIGNPFERFDEDWLRLLRAVRFAARFALRFEPRTWDALRTLSPMVVGVTPERRTEEVRLMLQGPNAGRAVGLLYKSGLWQTLWPNLPFTTHRVRRIVESLKKTSTKASVWKAFFTGISGDELADICNDLRLTRPEKKSLGLK